MRPNLEWRYRTPPIEPWWRFVVDAIAPLGELAVLAIAMGAIWWLAVILTAL